MAVVNNGTLLDFYQSKEMDLPYPVKLGEVWVITEWKSNELAPRLGTGWGSPDLKVSWLDLTTVETWVDLDGVLADFDGAYTKKWGSIARDDPDSKMWRRIFSEPEFFRNLPRTPIADSLFGLLVSLGAKPIILTSAGKTRFLEVAKQKKAWVAEHYPGAFVVPTASGSRKQVFCQYENSILIDDHPDNCSEWPGISYQIRDPNEFSKSDFLAYLWEKFNV